MIKKIKFTQDGRTGYGHLVFNDMMVGYHHISGPMPQAQMVVQALIADRHGYKAVQNYIEKGRKHPFSILKREGMSGCTDYLIQQFDSYMELELKGVKKHLMHISMFGTLNKGLEPLYVGDLVEVAADMFLYRNNRDKRAFKREGSGLKRKQLSRELIEKYGMKYIPERGEGGFVTRRVTNIFI